MLSLPTTVMAATKTVSAGPPGNGTARHLLGKAFLKKYQPDVNDFFLRRVTINQGDTVSFRINGFHTVDLPGSSGKDLPLFISGATVTGAKDFAGNPFWFNGKVRSLGLNPALLSKIGGSSYNGTARVDSGIFTGNGNPPPFPVKFTKAGTYKYFCDVHPNMVGYVVVRPKGKSIPTARQDSVALAVQLARGIAAVKAAAKLKPPANHVSLGSSGPGGVEDFAMFPSRLRVKVGTTVTFSMSRDSREVHTASFGPKAYLMGVANSINSPAPQQQAWYPSDPPGKITLAGSSTHGNGFVSTGNLDTDPSTPSAAAGKIK
ncbi:MAG: cupredoxin domain-containing protein, partial [Solirubrobacteraceae bacterium]